jgi:tyrosyl-tRNA synthetase
MSDEILTRGVERIYPSIEVLEAALAASQPLKIYFGIDPTAPTLHLGHASVLLKLRDLQRAGHQVIILFGDFTALIGDPTDKAAARVPLTPEQIKTNLKSYRKQISKILDLKKTEFKFNRRWLAKLNFSQILELASHLTFAQIIKRDMFQRRLAENKDLFLHEFLYPVMQGYDSVAMDVDAEIGGNDQTFNMLVGRDLMKSLKHKEKFVIATKLLTDPAGKKMGKSEGNMVPLSAPPAEMYGKIMSWPDEVMPLGFEILTRLPLAPALTLAVAEPKAAKMQLAREITKLFHGEKKAAQAERQFVNAFQKKEWPAEALVVNAAASQVIGEVLKGAGVVTSMGEWQRLVAQNGVQNWESGEVITDPRQNVNTDLRLKIGKRRFVAIKLI